MKGRLTFLGFVVYTAVFVFAINYVYERNNGLHLEVYSELCNVHRDINSVNRAVCAIRHNSLRHDNRDVSRYLQDISVTVKTQRGTGSGTMVQRKIDGRVRTFVWTAAHVVDSLRSEVDGVVTFGKPRIMVQRWDRDRMVEQIEYDCTVLRYSDADTGHDLALLMVDEYDAFPLSYSAEFMPAEYVPEISTELCHCGSLMGEPGANSYTTGVLSKVGRMVDGLPYAFDQITVVTFPGSSGGGVHLRSNGLYVGMLVRGARTQGFNLMVPVRAMHEWAKAANCEWALSDSVAVPTLYEIESWAVEKCSPAVYGTPDINIYTLRGDGAILFFHAPWCSACKRMQSEVLGRDDVQDALSGYAFMSLNYDIERVLARKHGVSMLPTLVVLAPNGEEIGRKVGFIPARQLIKWIGEL